MPYYTAQEHLLRLLDTIIHHQGPLITLKNHFNNNYKSLNCVLDTSDVQISNGGMEVTHLQSAEVALMFHSPSITTLAFIMMVMLLCQIPPPLVISASRLLGLVFEGLLTRMLNLITLPFQV
ncbi:unnamed protein product [Vicia faba]|uniref:Uncharacterized protein n=1 Tax=Vicia faba TaxID=3906 RepID=A0AAV0YG03_VICFA|nr:unnamed protein product [Vicia faba]